MLRTFRRSDAPQLFDLLQRHFPGENALLGFRPEAFQRIVQRLFRLDLRILLGLMELVRRPVVKFLVMESDGRLAATTLLTFSDRAGYVSTVMVDDPFRRRGYAKQLLERAARETARTGRSWIALDVLSDNAPARALYEKLGYQRLQSQAFYARESTGTAGPPPDPAIPAGLRPLAKSDGEPLAAISQAERPPAVAEVLPATPRQFFVPPLVTIGLSSETAAWVVDSGQGPEGFVRATVSPAIVAGNLTAPTIAPGLADAEVDRLISHAVAWLEHRGSRRIVAEVPESNVRGTAALQRAGFQPQLRSDTLALRLHG